MTVQAERGTGGHRVSRASMTIAALSTVIEWYDFTLYLYFATTLSRVFYGGGASGVAVTFGGFAIAYLMRPLGAAFFGHIGDRQGRRHMFLLTMAVMTLAMLAIALLPTGAAAGATAGWLLLLLRCIMAFAVGGEYTGVVTYLLEGARPERRGLITSLASAASEVGALLAAGVAAVTVSAMSSADLDGWGWRIPFLIGAAMAGLVWIARALMEESPDFEDQRARGSVPGNPLLHALRHHRAGIARGFAMSALGSITYYVGITYVPAFLTSTGGMREGSALWLSTVAAGVVILVTPFLGALSDAWGRRPVLMLLCAVAMVAPITMFSLMASGSWGAALAGALVLAALGGGVSAVASSATAEQFPGEGRLSGLALGVTSGTAIFGGLTPFVAELAIARTGSPLAPGVMIAVVALCVLPVLWRMPETRPEPGD